MQAAEISTSSHRVMGAVADAELASSAASNVQLQQTMQQMTEAHSGWRQAETDGLRRIQEENDSLRREWLEAKAQLGRERDRASDAKREASLQLAVAQEATSAAQAEVAKGKEEVAHLEGQVCRLDDEPPQTPMNKHR